MKSTNIVITQPMYLPWLGFFELLKFADICVFFDDVQYPRRHFVNRVQLRDSDNSINWLSIPLIKADRSCLIKDIKIDNNQEWRNTHINKVKLFLKKLPYAKISLEIIEKFLLNQTDSLNEINTSSIIQLSEMIGISKKIKFLYSSNLGIKGSSSGRILDICKELNATNYITAHGAKNYLNHEIFDHNGISVKYVEYKFNNWEQAFKGHSPYVSILDPIASVGVENITNHLNSKLVDWKNFKP